MMVSETLLYPTAEDARQGARLYLDRYPPEAYATLVSVQEGEFVGQSGQVYLARIVTSRHSSCD